MNTKNVLIFLGGMTVGGIIGAVGAIKWLDKTYQETLDKRVKEMEEYYGRVDEFDRSNYFNDAEVNPVDEDSADNGRSNGPLSNEARADIRERLRKNHEGTTNYAAMYSPKGNDIPEEDQDALLAERQESEEEEDLEESTAADEQPADDISEAHRRETGRPPRIISRDKLGELEERYETETLMFYLYDEVLTTEDEEPIDDPERLLGDSLTKFGFNENDEMVIYVQNFDLSTVYEVQKVRGAFSDED